jgi:hypothetical protein
MPSRVDYCDMLLLRKRREIFLSKKNITIVGVVWTLLLPVLEMCGLEISLYNYNCTCCIPSAAYSVLHSPPWRRVWTQKNQCNHHFCRSKIYAFLVGSACTSSLLLFVFYNKIQDGIRECIRTFFLDFPF